MELLWSISIGLLVVLIGFFAGYKLRPFVPPNKRFNIGFLIALTVLTMVMILVFIFPTLKDIQAALGTAFAIAFPLGISGPPYSSNNK